MTQLAKWKTAVQMIALAILLIGPTLVPYNVELLRLGLGFLWVAALLTLWTGYDYLKAAFQHVDW